MNKCFGVPSMFSVDSKFCKACPEFKRCCAECHDELMQIKELGDLSKAIAKHEAAMVKMGLLESKTYTVPRKTKKTTMKLDAAEEALLAELQLKGVLDQYNMLTGDLSLAPAPFALVVDGLKTFEKMSSSAIVQSLCYKLEMSKEDAIREATHCVRVLASLKIVKVTSNKANQVIVWLGS